MGFQRVLTGAFGGLLRMVLQDFQDEDEDEVFAWDLFNDDASEAESFPEDEGIEIAEADVATLVALAISMVESMIEHQAKRVREPAVGSCGFFDQASLDDSFFSIEDHPLLDFLPHGTPRSPTQASIEAWGFSCRGEQTSRGEASSRVYLQALGIKGIQLHHLGMDCLRHPYPLDCPRHPYPHGSTSSMQHPLAALGCESSGLPPAIPCW